MTYTVKLDFSIDIDVAKNDLFMVLSKVYWAMWW